jgi:TPR repeat protein
MKTANHLTDPIASERPFLTRLGLRLVAIIAGCAAAFLLAYLIMLPVMILGQKLGPGLGSTAWGLGICGGYLVYRLLCKRFKLILRSKSGLDELFEKEENEVEDSASTLYEGGSEQIIDDAALTENEALSENENATEPALERVEEVELNENEIKPTVEPIIEEEKVPQSEEQLQKVEEVSSVSKALTDTENKNTGVISIETKPDKAPKRRNTKRIKKICLIIAAIILAVGLLFVGRVLYLRIHTKTEHEQLVQSIKEKIDEGTIKRKEIEECVTTLEYCEENHAYCKYNHRKVIEELLDLYIQHAIDYSKTNIENSNIVARQLFKWGEKDIGRICDKYYLKEKTEEKYIYLEPVKINGMEPVDFITKDIHNYIKIAVGILEYAAEQGDAPSQFVLGCCYGGCDYTTDENVWYSYTMLGNKVDYKKSSYWYLQAAERGNASAMGNLGGAYLNGNGVTLNEEKGVYWIQRAANLNSGYFQRVLGDLYRDGVRMKIGSHIETRKTTDYSHHSDCIRSYWDSNTMNLVYVYKEDVPDYKTILPIDIKQAQYWWNLAAENGDETAKERLQQIYD